MSNCHGHRHIIVTRPLHARDTQGPDANGSSTSFAEIAPGGSDREKSNRKTVCVQVTHLFSLLSVACGMDVWGSDGLFHSRFARRESKRDAVGA